MTDSLLDKAVQLGARITELRTSIDKAKGELSTCEDQLRTLLQTMGAKRIDTAPAPRKAAKEELPEDVRPRPAKSEEKARPKPRARRKGSLGSVSEGIVVFLEQNRGKPFSAREIARGAGDANLASVRTLLRRLAMRGRIQHVEPANYMAK